MNVGAEQEHAWVLRAQKGDQEAFAELVQAYQKPVFNLAYRMLGIREEAEDAAQETFLRAYTRLDSYDPTRKFSSWILSVASHHCVDRLRKRKAQVLSMEELRSWRWLPDSKPRPEQKALQGEQTRSIREHLDRLPSQYRLAIILRYWYDLSYTEIAEVTESTESAVKSRLHRARRMMADQLAEDRSYEQAAGPAGRRVSENAVSQCF